MAIQQDRYAEALAAFTEWKEKGLQLDMSRGKPGKEQLDLVSDLLEVLKKPSDCIDDGMDARNYGELAGMPCARAYFAELLGCKPEQVFVGGNSSLALMYDVIIKAFAKGLLHSEKPWAQQGALKFLCPSPGYDRHFKMVESFGMELINVSMLPDGPDMDAVEEWVKDPQVKGIWCVPKYSNPDGTIYSEETIRRLAALKPAAPDFVLMWDNAYCIHELEGEFVPFDDILSLCAANGNADMVFEFTSTSKITLPGAGVACMACSEANLAYLLQLSALQTISYDKVNQLRHVRYLKNKENTIKLMKQHAAILMPKFRVVLEILERELAPLGLATWTRPKGGYFISLDTKPGLAKRTLSLCKEAGVTMAEAGAAFPYHNDLLDYNIRIAPSYPSVEELQNAMEIFCVCLKLAAAEQDLGILRRHG